ncbi:MAG TPA: beta-L-arabinofuranosidase domain-containing protein [Bryobacteraceae bacterium]
MNRRQFLATSAALSVGARVRAQDAATDLPSEQKHGGSREKVPPKLSPFPLSQVRLLPGVFAQEAEKNARYLDSLSVDRLLYSFRAEAGLNNSAEAYGGWEAPSCELRGHFNGGHYLSGCALAYATSSNEDLKRKGDQMVAALAKCQQKLNGGYLSAFPETFFDRLSREEKVWAPFYTLHKILAGLIDMYALTGNEQALQVAEGLGGWITQWSANRSDAQMQRILRTEYGGTNEALANLYAITGKDRYLHGARRFEQPSFFDPLAAHRDELTGLHANTNVPKVIGAARLYELTGDLRYRSIAEYFLEEVVRERTYAHGGTSNFEHWKTPPGHLEGTLTIADAECCVAYNMMKLARHVFSWTGDPRWMDYYERTLWNTRLGTQNNDGLKMYFTPLAAGYWKLHNSADRSFFCCTGTGVEEFAKFTDTIYFHDGSGIYVNQFLPSELHWPEKNIRLRQETAFPSEDTVRLTVRETGSEPLTLHIRVPEWTAAGGWDSINGKQSEVFAQPGSYLSIRRLWHAGDHVEIKLPLSLRPCPLPGNAAMQAAMYGPIMLAGVISSETAPPEFALTGEPLPKNYPDPQPAPKIDAKAGDSINWMEPVSTRDLTFRASTKGKTISVMPWNRITSERYLVYWDVNA